ncbi:MAG: sigma-70 family RNA polymerase sigma factor [Chloroflexota bacterium]
MSYAISSNSTPVTSSIDWNRLYGEHIGRVFNFFRYRVGDDQVAHDLTAATFEKAWKKRHQYRGTEEEFVGWMYAIARNVAHDYFRRKANMVDLDELVLQASDCEISDQVARKIEFGRLVHCIQQLPEREQEIMTLKYGADLNNRQIAKQLGLSESNIGSILHRTVKKLREQMEIQDDE